MEILNAVILGLIQAAGEFLPISSSAHLALWPLVTGRPYQGLDYDVILHLGTLLAVLVYFRKDWFEIIKNGLAKPKTKEGNALWLLVIATIPAAALGLVFHDAVETTLRSPYLIVFNLVVFACALMYADKKSVRKTAEFTLKTALIIGCAQCLALAPGVSRSGITITAALLLGFSRTESARISFLLSTPVIAGASVLSLRNLSLADINTAFIAGFLTAALGGFLVIKFLMKFISKHSFDIFVYYRWALGAAILLLLLL